MKQYLSNFRLPFRRDDSGQPEDLRREDMDFRIPHLVPRPKGLDINPARIQEQLNNLAVESCRQVQEGDKYLQQLNRVELKPNVRLKLSDTVLHRCARALTDLYRKYVSKGASFPENSERMTELTSAISLLRNLILSYKIILASDYGLSLWKFNQKLDRVDYSSVRIIELIIWLQRYLGIRFQKLSPQEWKDLNSIFFIYTEILDPSTDADMTGDLGLLKAAGIISDDNLTRSVASMYVSIQLFGLLDISSWPSKSIQTIEQYLHKHEDLINMSLGEPQQPYRDFVVTYADMDRPPGFNEIEATTGCYINLSKLKEQVSWDLDELQKKKFIGNEEKKRLQPHGKVADLASNQGLLNLLERSLSPSQRTDERKTLFGAMSVDVYTGLSECYRLLYEQTHGAPEQENESGFHNAAAKHSSLLVDEATSELDCEWVIINESEGGLLMRTVETRYMHAMEVGHMIAFRVNEDGVQREPQLGYITRLDRPSNGQVDVAVVKMSSLAEAVTIMEPGQNQNSQDLLPGILIRDLDQAWQLILPRYVSYVEGTPAFIKRQADNIPVRLGEATETKNGFIMFEARSPGLK